MFTVSRLETVAPPQLVAVSPVPETLNVPEGSRVTVTASPDANVMFTFVATEAQATVACAGTGRSTMIEDVSSMASRGIARRNERMKISTSHGRVPRVTCYLNALCERGR